MRLQDGHLEALAGLTPIAAVERFNRAGRTDVFEAHVCGPVTEWTALFLQ